MAVIALPDLLAALIVRLRAVPEVAALTGTRVSAALGDAWGMPTHAVLLRLAGGPVTDDGLPIQTTRVDVHCYGSTPLEAGRVWRTVQPALCPPQGTPRSFVAAGCRVLDVAQEGGPIPLVEDDTGWPSVVASYLVRWGEVPA